MREDTKSFTKDTATLLRSEEKTKQKEAAFSAFVHRLELLFISFIQINRFSVAVTVKHSGHISKIFAVAAGLKAYRF